MAKHDISSSPRWVYGDVWMKALEPVQNLAAMRRKWQFSRTAAQCTYRYMSSFKRRKLLFAGHGSKIMNRFLDARNAISHVYNLKTFEAILRSLSFLIKFPPQTAPCLEYTVFAKHRQATGRPHGRAFRAPPSAGRLWHPIQKPVLLISFLLLLWALPFQKTEYEGYIIKAIHHDYLPILQAFHGFMTKQHIDKVIKPLTILTQNKTYSTTTLSQ